MSYEEFMKKILSGPLVITSCILVSVIALFQFISLFTGRFCDLVEFSSTVILVVLMWMLYADAMTRNKKINVKRSTACSFAWTIVKLVSIGLGILFMLIVGIYLIIKAGGRYGDAHITAAGVIILIIGSVIYAGRLVICIFAVKEIARLKNYMGTVYYVNPRWVTGLIVLASLRGAGMIMQYIVSFVMYGSSVGEWINYLGMFGGGSFFDVSIFRAVNVASNVFVTMADLCYIALFILTALVVRMYCRAVKK